MTSNSSGTRPRGTTTSWLIFSSPVARKRQRQLPAHVPQRVALGFGRRARDLERAACPRTPRDARDLLLDRRRRAVAFDDQQRARAWPARPNVRHAVSTARSESSSMSSIAAGTTRRAISALTASTALPHVRKRRRQRRPRRRLRNQPQRDLRDDRQRAFRADQQLRQVVADDVLHRLRAGVHDLAGRQHRLERQHVALRRAVLERARSASAFGDVAAD